ncbi:MAG TPA: hypothetical protein VF456_28805 [Vicinamibacterales bacterium]
MNVRGFATRFTLSLVGTLALTITSAAPVLAQEGHSHGSSVQQNPLVKVVREITEKYKDVTAAEAAGYALAFGCVSGPDSGAMGLHYVNMPLVMDGEIDPKRPEIILYEPAGNGKVNLVGADYLVLADAWDKTHSTSPELMGQKFQQFEAPNRFGLPRFYTLHVWAWKENPTGTFVNWHSHISCDAFNGPNQ